MKLIFFQDEYYYNVHSLHYAVNFCNDWMYCSLIEFTADIIVYNFKS